jgi:hypothetical protein
VARMVPHAHMTVVLDCGEREDNHPKDYLYAEQLCRLIESPPRYVRGGLSIDLLYVTFDF